MQKGLYTYQRDLLRDGVAQPFSILKANTSGFQRGGSKGSWLVAMHLQRRVTNESLWRGFVAFLRSQARRHMDVVISSEEFDQGRLGWPNRRNVGAVNVSALALALRDFSTTVVVGYRPFFDWIASVHAQIFLNGDAGHCQPARTSRAGYEPLSQWLTLNRIRYLASDQGFYSAAVLRRYRQHFSDVRVHAMSDTLLEDIVCDDVAARNTCATLRASRSGGAATPSALPILSRLRGARSAMVHENARKCSLSGFERELVAGHYPWTLRTQSNASHGTSVPSAWVAKRSCLDAARLSLLRQLSVRFERYLLAESANRWLPAEAPILVDNVSADGGAWNRLLTSLGVREQPKARDAGTLFDSAVSSGKFCSDVAKA